MPAPTDSLYAAQWHFDLMANGRGRALLERVWTTVNGSGVTVAVYDTGVETDHVDLDANYDASLEISVGDTAVPGSWDFSGHLDSIAHGTACAGIIGAEMNGVGGVGIAWGTTLTGVNIFDPNSAASGGDRFLASLYHMAAFDVTSNSWGYDPFISSDFSSASSFGTGLKLHDAYQNSATTGRNGLGTIIVQAAGNDDTDAAYCLGNDLRYNVTVAALRADGFATSYSNYGASVLISAAGGEHGAGNLDNGGGTGNERTIVTTDLLDADGYNGSLSDNDYTDAMNGTSAATPMVSGVVALMLDANPNLGWRDVQQILAATAFHTGSAIGASTPGTNEEGNWQINKADNWNGGGMHTALNYGFGNLDAFGAVRLAESYMVMGKPAQTSANEARASTAVLTTALAPPDNDATQLTFAFSVTQNILIEHVRLILNLSHGNVNDLHVTLTSPEGTTIVVQLNDVTADGGAITNNKWALGAEGFRGELSVGTWTLGVSDRASANTGTVNSLQLIAFGTANSVNDTFILTDEFAQMRALDLARGTITDTDGGIDWLNVAAVSTDSTVNLNVGAANTIDGAALVFGAGTVIENAILGDGNDTVTGNAVANKLHGMFGNDTLIGGLAGDTIDGGTGDDTASYQNALVGVRANLLNRLVNTGEAAGDIYISIENLSGSNHADTLEGNASANVLKGGNGNDTLNPGTAGVDRLEGGLNDDTYVLGSRVLHSTQVTIVDTGGVDTVTSTETRSIATLTTIENLTLLGTKNINGTGNTSDNRIQGTIGINVLSGGNGNDTLIGDRGNDTLTGGLDSDIFVFNTALNATTNKDIITDFNVVNDFVHLDNSIFTKIIQSASTLGVTMLSKYFTTNADGLATGIDQRIIYETDTGFLRYDADGNKVNGVSGIIFADLASNLLLTNADFRII